MKTNTYSKKPLTVDQQIDWLCSRGLEIKDKAQAHQVLNFVSYYRLSGYFLPFKTSAGQFKEGTTFSKIWDVYQFDRELRLLVSDAIEKIEVAFRTVLVNATSTQLDITWYVDKKHYKYEWLHTGVLTHVDEVLYKKQEQFIEHYTNKYNEPKYPPIWMLAESLSFGMCSRVLSGLASMSLRREIASYFNQHPTVIESWLKTLTYVRNLCAHHARFWNRWFVIQPIVPKREPLRDLLIKNSPRFHLIAYVLHCLIKEIAPKSSWQEKLYRLFEQYPDYPCEEMGFDNDWKEDVFWQFS